MPRNPVGFNDHSPGVRKLGKPPGGGSRADSRKRERRREGGSSLPRVWIRRGRQGWRALTCPGPRGGWCDPGTQTQRPPAGRGSTPGPSRPARGPGASNSAGSELRRSPWPAWVRSPGSRALRETRPQARAGVHQAAARDPPAGEGRGRPEEPVSRCGRTE